MYGELVLWPWSDLSIPSIHCSPVFTVDARCCLWSTRQQTERWEPGPGAGLRPGPGCDQLMPVSTWGEPLSTLSTPSTLSTWGLSQCWRRPPWPRRRGPGAGLGGGWCSVGLRWTVLSRRGAGSGETSGPGHPTHYLTDNWPACTIYGASMAPGTEVIFALAGARAATRTYHNYRGPD